MRLFSTLRAHGMRSSRRLRRGFFWGTRGEQLLEVALSLPIVSALVVGGMDFAQAYRVQHELTNACREGARFAASESSEDLNCGSCTSVPGSVTDVRDVVANFLTQDNLTACTIGTTATYSASNQSWTYSSSTTGCTSFVLTIARGNTYMNSSSGNYVVATQVTLSWPFTWTYGKVAGWLNYGKKKGGGGSGPSLPSAITSTAIMQNLS